MDENARKEEFSYAYIKAIAAVAGYTVDVTNRQIDNAGIDIIIRPPEDEDTEISNMIADPRIEAQVKCTAADIVKEKDIRFPLPIKNYNKLRDPNVLVSRVLIVVLVPKEVDRWLSISENETLFKGTAYWISLKNRESVKNLTSITIPIPRENILTVEALKEAIAKVARLEEL